MRDDRQYLRDIVEAASKIAEFTRDHDEQSFTAEALVHSAVIYQLIIIGEAARRVSEELRQRFPQVPWAKATALRNISAHAYFGVKLQTVWETVQRDIPALRKQVEKILAEKISG